jgi:acetyl esterase/lipase
MTAEQEYQILEDVIYYGNGEPFWKLDLVLPIDSHHEMRPAVLLVHGGGFESCTKREDFESHMLRFLASHGYVTASVEYRLSTIAPFPSQFVDVRRALQFLRGHAEEYRIDPERIGAVGHSAGANLVSLLGLVPNNEWMDVKTPYSQYSGTVQVVVGLSGLYVFETWTDNPDPELLAWLGGLFPGRIETCKDRMQDASPATYIGKHEASFLLVHGDQDDVCPLAQSEIFLTRLQQAGYQDVALKVYQNVNHDTFMLPDLPAAILDYLDQRFK